MHFKYLGQCRALMSTQFHVHTPTSIYYIYGLHIWAILACTHTHAHTTIYSLNLESQNFLAWWDLVIWFILSVLVSLCFYLCLSLILIHIHSFTHTHTRYAGKMFRGLYLHYFLIQTCLSWFIIYLAFIKLSDILEQFIISAQFHRPFLLST